MTWQVEITQAAARVLREAIPTGWVDDRNRELEVAELVRAGLVYDGAVTDEGYAHDRRSRGLAQ